MKKLGLSALALAGVMAFSGCSCGKDGEYVFHSVEVKDGDETKTYTCEDGEERSTAGNLACVAAKALPTKYELSDEKVTITSSGFGTSVSKEYEAKIEDKVLSYKVGENWVKVGEIKSGKIIVGDGDYTYIYKK